MIYPRRAPFDTNGNPTDCTSVYISDITLLGSIPCDGSGGDCIWIGNFEVNTFGADEEDIEYLWETNLGAIQGDDDTATMTLWFSSTENTIIDVTCTVTTAESGYTYTKEFVTNNTNGGI
jgi:hypothetical protein